MYVCIYLTCAPSRLGSPRVFSPWVALADPVPPVSVKITLLSGEPLPCNPEAETALQPLIWHAEGLSFQGQSFLEECFFTDTGSGTLVASDPGIGFQELQRLHCGILHICDGRIGLGCASRRVAASHEARHELTGVLRRWMKTAKRA